jgi:hypothetical protein
MSCPSCGGEERRALAPGLWLCISQVPVTSGGPGLTDPRLGPPVIQTMIECGYEYQEGRAEAPASSCACGTFAIGRCQSCDQPVCGRHGVLVLDRLRCAACRRQDEDEAQRYAQQAAPRGPAVSIHAGMVELLRSAGIAPIELFPARAPAPWDTRADDGMSDTTWVRRGVFRRTWTEVANPKAVPTHRGWRLGVAHFRYEISESRRHGGGTCDEEASVVLLDHPVGASSTIYSSTLEDGVVGAIQSTFSGRLVRHGSFRNLLAYDRGIESKMASRAREIASGRTLPSTAGPL